MSELDPSALVLLAVVASLVLGMSLSHPFAFSTIVILFNERFFGMIPYRFGDYDVVRSAGGPLLITGAIILQLLVRPRRYRRGLRRKGSYLTYILVIVGVVAFATFWGGLFTYKLSLKSVLFQPIVFTYYFLYVYLSFFAPTLGQMRRFFVILVSAALLITGLTAVDAWVYREALLFKYANVTDRLGLVRIVIFMTGIPWAYYYALASADEKRLAPAQRAGYLLIAGALLCGLVFVQLDRQVLLACGVTTALFVFTMKLSRKLFLASAAVVGIAVTMSSPQVQFGESLVGGLVKLTAAEATTTDSNIGIRLQAMDYYYGHFRGTYGLGFGMLGSRAEDRTPVSQGLEQGYNLNDLSLTGIIFRFGIPALILILLTARKILKDTRELQRSGDPAVRRIARGVRYTVLHLVIIFPLTTFLFYSEKAVYCALMFYFVDRLKFMGSATTTGMAA